MEKIVEMIVGFRRSGAMLIPEGSTGDLIRCKDCKHVSKDDIQDGNEPNYDCNWLDIGVSANWFCADGERKDDD